MNPEILSENIRYYRKKLSYTQNRLAEIIFVSPQTVSKWEKGTIMPDTDKLCMLSDVFGVSIDSLVKTLAGNQKESYIAIDGGGTKTDFALFYETGEIIELISLGGSNPNSVGLSVTKKVLSEGIEKIISKGVTVKGIFAGISGAAAGRNKQELTDYLKDRYTNVSVAVESDIYNVINNGNHGEKCIAVICGTGSVVYGYNGEKLFRAGGWGYLFDNAGSGFDIGRDAVRHCLEVESGFVAKSDLYASIRETLEENFIDCLEKIYAKGNDYVASFAPIVFKCADNGDKTAQTIIEGTVDRLVGLISFVQRNYSCGNTVVISGGLAARKDVLEPMIKARLDSTLKIVFPSLPPIFGAAVKCIKSYGAFENGYESFYNVFKKSLAEKRMV